jgi:hypothetical protein
VPDLRVPDGLVILDVAEADPVVREEARAALGEPYRTPLGHVRHEAGHREDRLPTSASRVEERLPMGRG